MLAVKLTDYYRSLIDWNDPADPLAKMTQFSAAESDELSDDRCDLMRDHHSGSGISRVLRHHYPDRVLLLITSRCAAHCRYCFRKARIEQREPDISDAELAEAVAYVAARPAIGEIILSGGDPLALPNTRLLEIITAFRRIPQVHSIRLHTRFPVYQPARCDSLAEIAAQINVFIVQVNHAREVTPRFIAAMARLRPFALLYNQSVLLRGVNDSVAALSELSWALARAGITPCYLHYPDLIPGTDHFRLPLDRAIALVGALRGQVPGYLIPRLMLDIPGGYGKIALEDPAYRRIDHQTFLLRSPLTGELIRYHDTELA